MKVEANIIPYLQMMAGLENEGRDMGSFTLRHGRTWSPATIEETNPIIQRGAPKQCFSNSQKLLSDLLLRNHSQFTYVEGYACCGELTFAFPTLHAWLVDAQGRVVDPTWKTPENSIYFGVPFKTDYVLQMIDKTGHYHSLIDNIPTRWELLRDSTATANAVLTWNKDDVSTFGYAGMR